MATYRRIAAKTGNCLNKTGNRNSARTRSALADRAVVTRDLAIIEGLKREMDADQMEIEASRRRIHQNLEDIQRLLKKS